SSTDDACPCDPLPMLDAKWGIDNGVPAKTGTMGSCADPTHVFTFWATNYGEDVQNVPNTVPVEATSKLQVSCYAGIWLLTLPGNVAVGGQRDNSSIIDKWEWAFTGDLENDPCLIQALPEETSLDTAGVCPRDERQLVIRAINESLAKVTFEIDPNHVLTFDTTRIMWMLEYKYTGVKHWLVAVSCAIVASGNVNSECMCQDLPMLDATWGIANGVSAQVGANGEVMWGACANKAHRITFWGANYPDSIQSVAGNTMSFEDTA
ncbi:hypothetical protein PMAYCL1PPCAC_08943, partial [Pristionchus mayeri]